MPNPLVESIPNYSEGRRPEVVAQIAAAITAIPGVRILDQHSDADHNRTVITVLGEPQAVSDALFKSIAKAAELIDMDSHQGGHPRVGATDVVPFVPIRDISMAECVALAKALGQRVGNQLAIPVYLYEEAAMRPERANLEVVRRGQYEGLKQDIRTDPDRKPDFGPSELGKAGAVVIGAREALIAFNVYLNSSDENIAKKIAKSIRHSSGGFRFVKAMGITVDGLAQVSMNLTNFTKTPIAMVVETIRREAQRFGVAIHHSELVGLVPQKALVDAANWYLQLDQFEYGQILETRLDQLNAPASVNFLDALASESPAPGGGSASAFTAAQAAALAAMVARLTLGRKKYSDAENEMRRIIDDAEMLRVALTSAVSQDAEAYEAVMDALKLPKEDETQARSRAQAIKMASFNAAEVPMQVCVYSAAVMQLLLSAAKNGNLNAISDAGTGAALARAALSGAGANVRINLSAYPDDAQTQVMLKKLMDTEIALLADFDDLKAALRERANLELV